MLVLVPARTHLFQNCITQFGAGAKQDDKKKKQRRYAINVVPFVTVIMFFQCDGADQHLSDLVRVDMNGVVDRKLVRGTLRVARLKQNAVKA